MLRLPANLTIGRYLLKVTITDKEVKPHGGKHGADHDRGAVSIRRVHPPATHAALGRGKNAKLDLDPPPRRRQDLPLTTAVRRASSA